LLSTPPAVDVIRSSDPPHARLARSAGAAAAATLTSRILGLVRDQVLAAVFGAGDAMDAFNIAARIPNLVRDLFAEGAMSAAFVPTFTRYLAQHGKDAAWRLGNNVLTALFIVTGILIAAGMVFAPQIVTIYAGTFASVPGKLELTIRLTRVMLPFLTLAATAAAMMGMLNSLHRFFVPALSPATFNVAMIAAAVTLVPLMARLGWPPIMAIAISAIAGGAAQIATQWPLLRREGFRYRPLFDARDPGLRQVLILMGPGTLGLAATQVNLFVNTLLATSQGTGAVSWLNYAFRIMYLPIGLFGVSIATAVLPEVSRAAAADDREAVRATLARGLGLMLVLNVPATIGLIALSTPIVRLLLEHGRFLPSDTAPTAAAVTFYAMGLVGYSAARIASPTFYALRQSRVPVIVSVCTIAVNILLSVVFVRALGFRGLALGTSLAALANGALLLALLHRRLDGIHAGALGITLVKTTAAGIVMGGVAYGVEHAASFVGGSGLIVQAIRLGLAIGSGLATLAAAATLLRIREFGDAVALIRSRLSGRGGLQP
jgi:putative peptidoglycan lipid II flippase